MSIESIDDLLERRWREFADDVKRLTAGHAAPLGQANLPEQPGIYLLLDEREVIAYVGIAANLRDRLNRHVSGDESHAGQRAFQDQLPDRSRRRIYIKEHVQAKWLQVEDWQRLADLERLLIWLLQPAWNRR